MAKRPRPTSIATMNTSAAGAPRLKATRAGPGQEPTRPYPTPNKAAPERSFLSRDRDDGPLNVAAKSGASRLRPSANPTAETMTAEDSTRARLGYHDGAATSRHDSRSEEHKSELQ